MSESMRLYHGSPILVPRPLFGVGNPYNDYGLGFYCTESLELACEWACPKAKDGFANAYDLALDGLNIVDLDAEPYGTIEWLAVLFANRQFDVATNLMEAAKSYVAARYPAELGKADVIIGYRADDSYFSFARAFLENRISLGQLERAMKLGGLGRQVVAVSEAAFGALTFAGAETAPASQWHERRMRRDERARRDFDRILHEEPFDPAGVYMLDLVGEYRYAIVELPPSPYAHDLQEVLAFVFDIGVNLAGCTGEQVAQAFMASGLAEEFEKQNPVYVAGKSSYDLLRIMLPLLPCDEVPAPELRYDRTPDFWAGWALAQYQMTTGCSYRSIFATATYDEIRSMYWPLHEAPESKFVAIFDEMRTERAKATNLRTLREAAGLSQSQLAKASGVGVRSIQLYEQRQKDINKAQGIALYRLSRALRCTMEQLLER